MTLEPIGIPGAYRVRTNQIRDWRGSFQRTFCGSEFARLGLTSPFVQSSICFNEKAGTLRGLHWQEIRVPEAKLVWCVAGQMWDVVADVRKDSPAFGHWEALELHGRGSVGVFIPPGVAHGYVTLSDSTSVHYQMTASYDPGAARGVRWNDPQLQIEWPRLPSAMSERDSLLPFLKEI